MKLSTNATMAAALGTAALALGFAGTASAQVVDWTQGWSGQATLYAWVPSVTGAETAPDGQPIINLDNADVLAALNMAFMGTAEVRKGKFGLLFDAVYADITTDGTWIQERVKTSTDTKLGVYTAAAAYRVYDAEQRFVDLYAGARYFDTSVTFDISAAGGAKSLTGDLSWTDGIVGIRGAMPLSERWSISGFADVGGFNASSDLSWEFYGGANYAFAENWAATLGYRYMSIKYAATDFATLDIDVQGPLIGVTYKF